MNAECALFGIHKMTDFQDLQARAGQVQQSICELDDKHRDLLNGLQNGLNIAPENLIRMKFEIDRLTEENKDLRHLIERILDSVEGKSENALHDKFKELAVQLNVILGVSEDETATALGQVAEDLVKASQIMLPSCMPRDADTQDGPAPECIPAPLRGASFVG